MDKVKAEQTIREQILDICKELFESYVVSIQKCEKEARKYMPRGVPSAMLIAEFASSTRSMNKIKNGYISNEIVRAWRYCDKLLETIQMDKEPELSSDRRKNYEEVYVRYAFSVEEKLLYLNVFYAPLSAEGRVYQILENEGVLKLSDSKTEWVS